MRHTNHKIAFTVSILGVLLGLSGMVNHGIFEILQGNRPTNGFFIEAIGEAHRYWIHGTEAAFTVIHNFLATGIAAVLCGLAVIVWSAKYIRTKYGSTVFLLLLILLTLSGGGIGYILLFVPTWAFATRINKPLTGWKKILPPGLRKKLLPLWIYTLAITVLLWLSVMETGIFGYFPGMHDPDAILTIVFIFLFATAIMACLTFICAISADIQSQNTTAQ